MITATKIARLPGLGNDTVRVSRHRVERPDFSLSRYSRSSMALLFGGLFLPLASANVATDVNSDCSASYHHTHAFEHAAIATLQGEKGRAETLTRHAETALQHAEVAEKYYAEVHQRLQEAVTQLKAAIKQGKQQRTEQATQHTDAAVTRMREAHFMLNSGLPNKLTNYAEK